MYFLLKMWAFVLPLWAYVLVGFCPRGFCPRGFCPRGFCPTLAIARPLRVMDNGYG